MPLVGLDCLLDRGRMASLDHMTYKELVAESRQQAEADPAWVGSDAHLQLLQEALEPLVGVQGVTVRWAEPGDGAHWHRDSSEIRMRKVPPNDGASPADAAETHFALTLMHEGLHALLSSSAEEFFVQINAMPPRGRGMADGLFQRLEDGRIRLKGVEARPELSRAIEVHTRAATYTLVGLAVKAQFGQTKQPISRQAQLLLALQVYALAPEAAESLTLHPEVAAALNSLKRVVDATRPLETADCGAAAIELVSAVRTLPD
jgi:hypothetical protein